MSHGLFASIPLADEQIGLRHIAFSPSSFGQLGDKLFVSVSSSIEGGGFNGRLLVLDGEANIIGELAPDESTPFDPRGVFFRDDGSILISDTATGSVLLATAADFGVVPEPSIWTLLVALAVAGTLWRQNINRF